MRDQNRSMDLAGNLSLSHSRRAAFRRCRRYYYLKYIAKLDMKVLPAPLRMGGIYSDGIEACDPEIVTQAYHELISEAVHESNSYLAEIYLDELAVVKPMVQTYIEHVMLDDVEREVAFKGFAINGRQDNGYLDGLKDINQDNFLKLLVENKLKGRWGRAEEQALSGDDQLTGYIFNVCCEYDVTPDQVLARYEVAKKPALRQRKDETREAFRIRIHNDILSRPDFYHVVVTDPELMTRSQDQLDEWKILFARMTEDIADEYDRESQGDEGAWPKNPDACSDYGGCDMAKICWAKNPADIPHIIETGFVVKNK